MPYQKIINPNINNNSIFKSPLSERKFEFKVKNSWTLTPFWLAVQFMAIICLRAAPLHLHLFHEISTSPILLDALRYQNSEGEPFSITRLSWLASGFSFTTAGGEQITIPDMVVFVPSSGSNFKLAGFPDEYLKSVSFQIGLDHEINHADPSVYPADHPLNPNFNSLHWDWQGGYIFMAVEGHWRMQGERNRGGYAFHFARDPNRIKITLALDLDLSQETEIGISLDAIKLLDGISFGKHGATTHSTEGDPISERLKFNLTSAFRIAGTRRDNIPGPAAPAKPIDLPADPKPYPIRFPRHVPPPKLPTDNPIISQRVLLGEKLFQSKELSRNKTVSCESCHLGETFSDSRRFSPGVDGEHGNRHSMPLFNLAWKSRFFWDGRAASLREQALAPIQDPLEMDETLENVVAKLEQDSEFPQLFADAFGSGTISPENIGLALENYLLTQVSFDSRIDQVFQGKAFLTPQEQRGFELFFTEFEPRMGKQGADCFHCHGGAHFTDHAFHNNGLAVTGDIGLEKTTGRAADRYKFSTPSLRNISKTAPYMHDGRFTNLEEVVEHYNAAPIRSNTLDPNIAKHRTGLGLSKDDQAALVV